jgi:uncharacterized protein
MDIETKLAKYSILKDLGILVNEELKEEYSHLTPHTQKKEEAVKILEKEYTNTEIMENLANCSKLALVTTEACNFRCKYCSYSGKYQDERVHSDQKMSIDTARKAVNFLFNLVSGINRKNKMNILFIGFYGGESLLEFQLVKDTISYAETEALKRGLTKRFDIHFRLNTNGYLLSNRFVDFLKEKDVHLDISLDGPEEEHDRFRVTREGRRTWSTIITNLKKLKQKYPDYYHRRVNYLAIQHPLHNSEEIDRFFSHTSELFTNKIPRISSIKRKDLKQEEADVLGNIKFKPGKLYSDQLYKDLARRIKIQKRKNGIGLTHTCFPGAEKILVNVDGSLSICEKISHHGPRLGHLEKGFDFDRIRHIIKEYSKAIVQTECWECPVWFLCDMCIAMALEGNQFQIDCSAQKTYFRIIKSYIEEKEQIENREYSQCCDSVIDFIEQL